MSRASTLLALAAILPLLAWANALGGAFVVDDVPFYVGDGEPLRGLTGPFWAGSTVSPPHPPLYRPVASVAMAATRALFGEHPAPHHAFGLGLHLLVVGLSFRLAARVLPEVEAAGAALLFAVHPIHVEAVTWIVAFAHPLATALAIGAVLLQDRGRAALAAVASAGAMLTVESGFAAPLLVVAWDRRAIGAQAVAVAGVLAARWAALGSPAFVPAAWDPSFVVASLRDLVLPWPQRLHLGGPDVGVATWAGAAACGAVLLRGGPGVAWVLLGLVPVAIGSLHAGAAYAPRALYLPSVGIALLLGPWLARAPVLALAGAGLVALANPHWRSDEAVYARAAPHDVRAALALGDRHLDAGRLAEAEPLLSRARAEATDPKVRVEAGESLATAMAMAGRPAEAEPLLRDVLAEAPGRSSAWVALGNVRLARGDPGEAAACYRRALALDPGNAEAAHDLRVVTGR